MFKPTQYFKLFQNFSVETDPCKYSINLIFSTPRMKLFFAPLEISI